MSDAFSYFCPVPDGEGDVIEMAHGGGGLMMHGLIERVIRPAFATDGTPLAFTTDSYVVRPLIFPGGDIGSLAVNGTVNDLAMCGARPLYLSSALILEEGLAMETLRRVVESMHVCAAAAGVQFVTGDTKV